MATRLNPFIFARGSELASFHTTAKTRKLTSRLFGKLFFAVAACRGLGTQQVLLAANAARRWIATQRALGAAVAARRWLATQLFLVVAVAARRLLATKLVPSGFLSVVLPIFGSTTDKFRQIYPPRLL